MGLKSILGKIGKIGLAAAPFIAAPFTGGASLLGAGAGTGMASKILGGLSAAAPVLGGLAEGRAKGQQAEDDARMRLFQLLLQQQQSQAQLGQDKAKFELEAPNARLQQAIRGNLTARMQDVTANAPSKFAAHRVSFSGGLRPSALGSSARRAGENLANLGASRLGTDSFEMPTPLAAPKIAESSFLDKFLGIAAPTASILGSLQGGGGGQGQQSPYTAPPPPDPNDPASFIDPRLLFQGGSRNLFGDQ